MRKIFVKFRENFDSQKFSFKKKVNKFIPIIVTL